MAEVAATAQSRVMAKNAVLYLTDNEHLIALADTSPDLDIRLAAIGRITDTSALRRIALHGEHRWERLLAIAVTSEIALLNELILDGREAGKLASLRLASLQLSPPPKVRLGFISREMGYRYVGDYANRAYLKGEMIEVSLLHPDEGEFRGRSTSYCEPSRYKFRSNIVFQSEYPTVYKPGYVPADIDESGLQQVLTDYLEKAVDSEEIARLAVSAVVPPLLKAAASAAAH